ncbi:MAG TPA: hypothetical protein VD867_15705, partial [Burkholderiales bacterium]|nr:hypothetical protein [Burkholderiales bacterium]
MPPPTVVEHIHPLPVCGFDQHRPNAPQCAGLGTFVACGQIIDPTHPGFGQALCWHRRAAAPPPVVAPVPVPPPVPVAGMPSTPDTTAPDGGIIGAP